MPSFFDQHGYEVVRDAVSKDTAKLAAINFNMVQEIFNHDRQLKLDTPDGDNQVENSFSWYGSYITESLMLLLRPVVEKISGKQLYPTYSYGRIYYPGATLKPHVDGTRCEYSATITLDCNGMTPWEICFKDLTGAKSSIMLGVGDICVYKGPDLEHWRNTFTGTKQIQAFLHYVDVNGPYANLKYDGRAMPGTPFIPPE